MASYKRRTRIEKDMAVEIWRDVFQDRIEELLVPHVWNLTVDTSLQKQPGWLQYTQCTFGRFRCSLCTRWWNSAEIHVLFLMKLDRTMRRGTVNMRIFRQECKKCTSAVMEKPEISLENITIIIGNLVKRIQSKFYSLNIRNEDAKPAVYSERREGPHNKEHCEACKQNVCRWLVSEVKAERRPASGFGSAGRNSHETTFREQTGYAGLVYSKPRPAPKVKKPSGDNQGNTFVGLVSAVICGLALLYLLKR
ncbi:receptor-transporting protein 3 [Xenopus laevis]|uniref:Receptor-transporting protein 3 n=1 Tax=Xenopus laevis TaxID=8355 RepID=A0A8J0V9S4_XENLA|nr:receptor-transporting protein 3 [Xenopus laevis]